jgi:hypothetical protein
MKLSEIEKMWLEDCRIDDLKLDAESLKIPNLHAKYFQFYNQQLLSFKKLQSDFNVLNKRKWEYYSGKCDQAQLEEYGWEPFQFKILKSDLSIYLDGDHELNELRDKINYQKTKVDYIENIIRTLNGRGYLIKNAIDFLRFSHGQL